MTVDDSSPAAPHNAGGLQLALIQTDLAWQDAEANRHLLDAHLKALPRETDLVILPEMFTSAFTMADGALAEDWPGPTLAWMQAQAAALDAAVTGSIAVRHDGKRFNRLLFVLPDGSHHHYDKKHLFRMLGEDTRYTAGDTRISVDFRGWRICPMVCYDLRFPVWCRQPRDTPYDLLLFVANWPAPRNEHWRTLLRARAIENLSWVAGVNRVGTDGNGLTYAGHSAVVDPQGREALQAGTQAGHYNVFISRQELDDWRSRFPAWMDADDYSIGSSDQAP